MALGDPSPKELVCLANLREWERGLEFDRQFRGGGALKPVQCAGYEAGVTIGAPALKKPKPKPKRRPAWWQNASKAVQRDWLRDRERASK